MAGPVAPDRKPRAPAGPGHLANRSDLSVAEPPSSTPQGAYIPPDQPYGDRQRFEQGLATAPIPAAPASKAGGGGSAGGGGGAGVAPSPPASSLAALLGRPTERPDEHVTTGLLGSPSSEATTTDSSYLHQQALQLVRPGMPPMYAGLGRLLAVIDGAQSSARAKAAANMVHHPDFGLMDADQSPPPPSNYVDPILGPLTHPADPEHTNHIAAMLGDLDREQALTKQSMGKTLSDREQQLIANVPANGTQQEVPPLPIEASAPGPMNGAAQSQPEQRPENAPVATP